MPTPKTTLSGRDAESARLSRLLAAVHDGDGGGVLVLGDAGMGKTALLDAVRSEADEMTVAGVRGVGIERNLPFAGLHRLLAPVGDIGAELRAAMRDPADDLPLRYGAFELLCRLAAERPVLCWIDDAQWLDPESLDVLGFAARRLAGHRVAMVLLARPELVRPECPELADVPRLWLPPLSDDACEQLLADRTNRCVPAGMRAALTDLAGGNPHDLVELAGSLTGKQLAGRAPLPDQLPEGPRRAECREALSALAAEPRHALLCAAAEPTVDVALLRRLGGYDALEAAGLVRVDGAVVRLPSKLVRSTLYALAADDDRRRAHATLAEVLTGPQRVWHAAMAGDDDAGLGEELAAFASSSDDPAATATALARSARLASDAEVRASRLLAAARHAWRSGRPGWARRMLAQAWAAGADHGLAAVLHGEMELRDGDPTVATHELASAAVHLSDPARAAEALLLSGEARRLSGDLRGYYALAKKAGSFADSVPEQRRPESGSEWTTRLPELMSAHFRGLAAVHSGRHADAREPLSRVVRIGYATGSLTDDVASAVWAAEAAFALGWGETAYDCASAAVSRARMTGREALLPWALVQFALAAIVLDRHSMAQSAASEGLAVSSAAAQRNTWVEHLSLLGLSAALRGDREHAESTLGTAAAGIAERGLGRPAAIASWARACLDLIDDRPADALGRLEAMAAGVSGAQPAIQVLATPQLVEAAVLVEQPERARRAVTAFDGWVQAGGSDAWLALSHRCHGLLAAELDEAAERFEAAIGLHRTVGAAMELARTQLAYAHRLRRHRRSRDARDQFRDALRVFEAAGAECWAERAKAGLRATGESVSPTDTPLSGLTPQQTEISRLVAAGDTNKEIARRLVISHRTVDHHLRNIFTALGVRSRVELARRVSDLA